MREFILLLCATNLSTAALASPLLRVPPYGEKSSVAVLLDVREQDLGEVVQRRIRRHLAPWTIPIARSERKKAVQALLDRCNSDSPGENIAGDMESTVVISFGNTTTWQSLMQRQVPSQPLIAEGISLRIYSANGVVLVASNGAPMDPRMARSRTQIVSDGDGTGLENTGAITAAYALLEELGFSFLHPLQPIAPKWLRVPRPFEKDQAPRWTHRGFHVHTMHPLELTDVLQGFDMVYTEGGSSTSLESWESMVDDVELFFEWCAANRVNRVQWILLGNDRWGGTVSSALRHERLRLLVTLAHRFGVLVGVDVPLGLLQQHAWVMVTPWNMGASRSFRIEERCRWVASAGFDFIATESGLSEFSNPGEVAMLELLDGFAEYVNGTLALPSFVKVHISQGQHCRDHKDPRNASQPLNFNFLPTYATPKLGVLPHTVQAYGLDDPAAGVYGNQNFQEMREFMFYEAQKGDREVLYYGETAYWVSVDIDVPLFMPVYGERRLHDLRLIAEREDRQGFRLNGQMNFDSGWEWGYWLNNVVTARAAWDPVRSAATDSDALRHILTPLFCELLGARTSAWLADWIARLSHAQHELLLLGKWTAGPATKDTMSVPHHLTGMGYLAGSDTWFEVPRLAHGVHMTQPDKIMPHETSHPLYPHISPLLSAMENTFDALRSELNDAMHVASTFGEVDWNIDAWMLLEEIKDGMDLLVGRARHVKAIYSAASPVLTKEAAERLLQEGRSIIQEAEEVVHRRESRYRVPLPRVALWRETGPTVYRYGYLWAVHSLYFWWRDQGKAELGLTTSKWGPCYLNRIDPLETAVGWGKHTMQIMRLLLSWVLPPFQRDMFANCLAPPVGGFEFPRDLFPEAA
jgi:hypothetical protein